MKPAQTGKKTYRKPTLKNKDNIKAVTQGTMVVTTGISKDPAGA